MLQVPEQKPEQGDPHSSTYRMFPVMSALIYPDTCNENGGSGMLAGWLAGSACRLSAASCLHLTAPYFISAGIHPPPRLTQWSQGVFFAPRLQSPEQRKSFRRRTGVRAVTRDYPRKITGKGGVGVRDLIVTLILWSDGAQTNTFGGGREAGCKRKMFH